MENKKFTIIGKPVAHSKSPLLFKAAYTSYPNLSYQANQVESAADGILLYKNGYCGGNVTAPFKEDILQFADEISADAQFIGAANCILVQPDGRIHASNSDYLGVSGSLEEHEVAIKGTRFLLLGAGGAGKAAAYGIHRLGGLLTIVNRTEKSAKELATKVGGKFAGLSQVESLIAESDVIINTLYPDVDLIREEYLSPEQVILDASYIGSVLLDKAKRRKCKCIDGKYWLFHQAIPAFVLFTGISPDREAMREVIGLDRQIL